MLAGNTAFFVAGDAVNGYELWKSDGSVAGTKMVKDINPGAANSIPQECLYIKMKFTLQLIMALILRSGNLMEQKPELFNCADRSMVYPLLFY